MYNHIVKIQNYIKNINYGTISKRGQKSSQYFYCTTFLFKISLARGYIDFKRYLNFNVHCEVRN